MNSSPTQQDFFACIQGEPFKNQKSVCKDLMNLMMIVLENSEGEIEIELTMILSAGTLMKTSEF
jgi:hypothetical protein